MPVISVENLSKSYRLGQINTGTFSRDLEAWWARLRGKPNPHLRIGETDHGNRDGEELWALRDVSFTVQQGEVLGIIGRNGAGKSTLLKILSRVTAPTSGRIRVKGRVASLLEVGTGFHPELTGRENVYLNGAILGMTRQEVTRKFDEIVDFAGVEKFIDTPVKRYSSGMYVRLAFAVAAHLDPEILVVDEVLAVGDAEFQKKCLGKMGEVAQGGRTVLFVSHNLNAIKILCSRAVLISLGEISACGSTDVIVEEYIENTSGSKNLGSYFTNQHSQKDQDGFRLIGVNVISENNSIRGSFNSNENIYIEIAFEIEKPIPDLSVGFDLQNSDASILLRSLHTDQSTDKQLTQKPGVNKWKCKIPQGFLNSGKYLIAPKIGIHNLKWIVNESAKISFDVSLNHGVSPYWSSYRNNRGGYIAPILNWESANS
jgi:lipopolysaccharide transport system ATP-binding protein